MKKMLLFSAAAVIAASAHADGYFTGTVSNVYVYKGTGCTTIIDNSTPANTTVVLSDLTTNAGMAEYAEAMLAFRQGNKVKVWQNTTTQSPVAACNVGATVYPHTLFQITGN